MRTDSVPDGSRVRHFDELDERAQDALAGLDGESAVCDAPGLADADVVVYHRLLPGGVTPLFLRTEGVFHRRDPP